jgi:mitotic spindle assembly checkpoint protein MAD2
LRFKKEGKESVALLLFCGAPFPPKFSKPHRRNQKTVLRRGEMAAVPAGGELTLSGSCEQIREFFAWVVQSILYQRGVYDPKHFAREQKYRQILFRATEPQLVEYLDSVLEQLDSWVDTGNVQRLVLVLHGLVTGEPLERWTFLLRHEKTPVAPAAGRDENGENQSADADLVKATQRQIAALMRQVTSSVTYLPMIEEACSFELEVYADKEVDVPKTWAESDPRLIQGDRQAVRLNSFTTSLHTIDSVVQYKVQ